MVTVDGCFADDGFVKAVWGDEVILTGFDVGLVHLASLDASDRLWGTNTAIACWVLFKNPLDEFGVFKNKEQVDAIKAAKKLWSFACKIL